MLPASCVLPALIAELPVPSKQNRRAKWWDAGSESQKSLPKLPEFKHGKRVTMLNKDARELLTPQPRRVRRTPPKNRSTNIRSRAEIPVCETPVRDAPEQTVSNPKIL